MKNHTPCFIDVFTLKDAKREIQAIGSDPKSINIMAPKAIYKVIKLHEILLQDAIIIKQDMLSVGGEVAIPKDAFDQKEQPATILIMGTLKQLWDLVGKLQRHYPRIQTIAEELSVLLAEIR